MAWAICTKCRKRVSWRAGRGCRLQDHRCPDCGGGPLIGQTTGQPSQSKGKTYQICAVCNRRRLQKSMYVLAYPARLHYSPDKEICANQPICHWHVPEPINFIRLDAIRSAHHA